MLPDTGLSPQAARSGGPGRGGREAQGPALPALLHGAAAGALGLPPAEGRGARGTAQGPCLGLGARVRTTRPGGTPAPEGGAGHGAGGFQETIPASRARGLQETIPASRARGLEETIPASRVGGTVHCVKTVREMAASVGLHGAYWPWCLASVFILVTYKHRDWLASARPRPELPSMASVATSRDNCFTDSVQLVCEHTGIDARQPCIHHDDTL